MWMGRIIFIFNFIYIVPFITVYLHTECPTLSHERNTPGRFRPDPGTSYDREGLDLKHDASHAPQVGQGSFAAGKDEAEISQQVGGEEKELHLGNSLPQTESRSTSEWDQGTGGASSSFQKALWNIWGGGFKKKKYKKLQTSRATHQRCSPGLKLYGSDQTAGSW